MAQNDGICRLTGCFRTSPVEPLHHLTRILPIALTLTKLRGSYADCLSRVPPSSLPCTILLNNPVAIWPAWFSWNTALASLPAPLFTDNPFTIPAHPSTPIWVNPQCQTFVPKALNKKYYESIKQLISNSPPTYTFSIFIHFLNTPHPHGHASSGFLVVRRGVVVDSGWRSSEMRMGSLLLALQAGLQYALFGLVSVFLPSGDILPQVVNLRKHPFLHLSSSITHALDSFLSHDPAHHMGFYCFKKSWSGLPGKAALDALKTEAQDLPLLHLEPLSTPTTRPKQALASFTNQYHAIIADESYVQPAYIAATTPLSFSPPPAICGALSVNHRHYGSAFIQTILRHNFSAEYSLRVRSGADDELYYHCSRPQHPHLYTTTHILFRCPLYEEPQQCFIRDRSRHFLFSTYEGAYALVQFIHYSQALLRPLPPRPDPP